VHVYTSGPSAGVSLLGYFFGGCGLLVPCVGLYPVLCMKSGGGNLASVPWLWCGWACRILLWLRGCMSPWRGVLIHSFTFIQAT